MVSVSFLGRLFCPTGLADQCVPSVFTQQHVSERPGTAPHPEVLVECRQGDPLPPTASILVREITYGCRDSQDAPGMILVFCRWQIVGRGKFPLYQGDRLAAAREVADRLPE